MDNSREDIKYKQRNVKSYNEVEAIAVEERNGKGKI